MNIHSFFSTFIQHVGDIAQQNTMIYVNRNRICGKFFLTKK